MNRRQVSFLLASALVWSGLSGCSGTSNLRNARLSRAPIPPPPCDRCAGTGPMPPRFAPTEAPGIPVPPPPGQMTAPPPAPPAPPPAPPPSTVGTIQQNTYVAPGPSAPSGNAPAVYLEQPQPVAPPASAAPPRTETPQTTEPPLQKNRDASPPMPVDIPHFAMVTDGIASGQEPFADGVTWLKSHGYRTVLHVRTPGEDDRAARPFEQAGLRYLHVEVSPRTLSKDIVDRFNRTVAEAGNRPLFVFDKDGSLAGALWYLHFRLVDRQ
ncbi:MAG: fused DSP-PTPase phosphatase/NAD kinase-like protein, partial [Gemmataceae bacterium]